MGGFHLIEPIGADSSSPVANTGTEEQPVSAVVDVVPMDTAPEGTNTNLEKGPPPSGDQPEPEEGRVTILTLEMLRELIKDPNFEIRVTEAEITDRSKGDGLSKIIFILQTSWFITQCLARHVQGLDLTQLELTTLALASLNGITFFLWWDKPLGAQTPVHVELKRRLTDSERDAAGVSGLLFGCLLF